MSNTTSPNDEPLYPATKQQQGLYFVQQQDLNNPDYHIGIGFRLSGDLNIERLEAAFIQTANCFACLRTQFVQRDGVAYQQINDRFSGTLQYLDLTDSSQNIKHLTTQSLKIVEDFRRQPMRLDKDPLCKGILIQITPQEYYLYSVQHHIISDGVTFRLFAKALDAFYNNSATLFPVQSTVDYISWQQQQEQLAKQATDRDYWQEQLRGACLVLDFPDTATNVTVPADKQRVKTVVHNIELDAPLVKKIRSFSRSSKTTIFCFFSAVFNTLLYRYYQFDEVTLGYVNNLRPQCLKTLPGYYVDLFPLRTDLSANPTVATLLSDITQRRKSNRHHQSISLVDILQLLREGKIASSQGDFNVTVVESVFTVDQLNLPNVTCESLPVFTGDNRRDLELRYDPALPTLPIHIHYDSNLFDAAFIQRMSVHLTQLMSTMADNPNSRIGDLAMLSNDECKQRCHDNKTAVTRTGEALFHQLFAQQARQSPDAPAIVFDNQQLTYSQLDNKTTGLAIYLQSLGVKPNTLVALCVHRSLEMAVLLLSILKAGGVYVPLDPHYPKQRLKFMLQDSQAKMVLTHSTLQSEVASITPEHCQLICVDTDWPLIEKAAKTNKSLKHEVRSHDLAYVLYTSGSTGQPKGVMIEHESLTNLLLSVANKPGFTQHDSLLAITTYCFDIAAVELFLPLMKGGKCYIGSKALTTDAAILAKEIDRIKPSVVQATPVTWAMLLQSGWTNKHKTTLFSAGDTLDEALKNRLLQSGCKLWNLYGPTETTIFSTMAQMSLDKKVDIGQPIDNTQVYILDKHLNQLPTGLAGELYISGAGLARGYLNQQQLTAKQFIANPFDDSDKLYKTGDLARVMEDGSIEHLGRLDHQLKVRGLRIECGEIESRLNNHPAVKHSVVFIAQNGKNQQLIACYCHNRPVTAQVLRSELAKYLPDYMIPDGFVVIDKIPLTPNGKIDRKALSAQQSTIIQSEAEYQPPVSDLQNQLVAIWQTVLQRPTVGIADNLFEIGGNSLLVMQLVHKINQNLKQKLNVTDIFANPTIEHQASFIESKESKNVQPQSPDPHPVKPQQQTDIAVIGLACRFPGAANADEFWQNLKSAEEGIEFFNKQTPNSDNHVGAQAYLSGFKAFDAEFFGYSPREAQQLDPQQRIFLEQAFHAMEDAGYNSDNCQGKVGVYAGSGFNNYRSHTQTHSNSAPSDLVSDYQTMLNNGADFLASRVAYKLSLTGPALVIQTACSTSLVAIHQACVAIKQGNCDMALAGGVSLLAGFDKTGYRYQQGMILSPDGHCRPFDSQAQGTVPAHGVGVVVLKPLKQARADGDNIRAIVKGSAVNNDGSLKVGYTAPGVDGQQQVIRQALLDAHITADQISYVETHGTATALGDPVEIQALTQTFNSSTPDKTNKCAIGSVKSNIGHTDIAAGVAGFIKTVLCLQHQTLVPTLHYRQANPNINFEQSRFYVNTQTQPWPTENQTARLAGISAFGIGGTNAHVILQQAKPSAPSPSASLYHLLPISAKTTTALHQSVEQLRNYLSTHPEILVADIAHTLQTGRQAMACRDFLIVDQQRKIVHFEPQAVAASDDNYHSLMALGKVWQTGGKVDWKSVYGTEKRQRVSLPPYPFATTEYWLDATDVVQHKPAPLWHHVIAKAREKAQQSIGIVDNPAVIEKQQRLSELSLIFMLQAFKTLGYFSRATKGITVQDLLQKSPIKSQFKQLAAHWLKLLVEHRYLIDKDNQLFITNKGKAASLAQTKDKTAALWTDEKEYIGRVLRCGDHLTDCLSGKSSAVSYLSQESNDLNSLGSANLAQQSPAIVYCNGIVKSIIATIVDQMPQNASLNILEIGGGSGYAASVILPLLKQKQSHYSFTDISPLLLDLAATKFKSYPFLHCNKLNIEQSPQSQGYRQYSFDLVIAVNSLHTTRNISQTLSHTRELLATGGFLILWEITGLRPDFAMSEAFLMQPLEDGERTSACPFWSVEQWHTALLRHGFAEVEVLPDSNKTDQYILLARAAPTPPIEAFTGQLNDVTAVTTERVEAPQVQTQTATDITDVKAVIKQVWQDYLGIEQIDDEDDFFDLGGDSLIAVNVIGQLQKRFGLKLSFASLLQHARLSDLEQVIRSSQLQTLNEESSLLLIQQGNADQEPIFMVHPAGGQVYFYRNLAKALGDKYTIYGFQSLMRQGERQITIEQMATDYIKELLEAFPDKPSFILGGASLGGIIAVEMALQLQQLNRKVDKLINIDAPGPGFMPQLFPSTAAILIYLANQKLDLQPEALEKLDCAQQIELVKGLEQSQQNTVFPPYLTVTFLETFKAQNDAMHRYQFKPFAGDVVYFAHSELINNLPSAMHRAWQPLIKGTLTVHQVPGTHITMNMPPHVEQTARFLKSWFSVLPQKF